MATKWLIEWGIRIDAEKLRRAGYVKEADEMLIEARKQGYKV